MALTDTAIRAAKAKDRVYKLSDGHGLYLLVTKAGGKLWRLKYRVAGKEKLLSLGAYPALTLGAARKAADKAREQVNIFRQQVSAPVSMNFFAHTPTVPDETKVAAWRERLAAWRHR